MAFSAEDVVGSDADTVTLAEYILCNKTTLKPIRMNLGARNTLK